MRRTAACSLESRAPKPEVEEPKSDTNISDAQARINEITDSERMKTASTDLGGIVQSATCRLALVRPTGRVCHSQFTRTTQRAKTDFRHARQ
jgi:hypothetical protein